MTQNLPTHPRVHLLTLRQVLAQKPPSCPAVDVGATVQDALRAMIEQAASAVLVVDATRLVGLFSERDMVRHAALAGNVRAEATPVRTVMAAASVGSNPALRAANGVCPGYTV